MFPLSLWRLQHMMNNGGGGNVGAFMPPQPQPPPINDYNDYSTPITGYNFDEVAARHAAQRSGRGALIGGLLDSYLNGGQNIGRAFELQRGAYDNSIDRAREDAQRRMLESRQRQMDASLEAARRAEIDNKRVDNERAQRDAEARSAENEAKRKADEADIARIAAQRARLLKDNPAAADYSPKQVESEYVDRYGYHNDKPQEISPGAYLRDPRTGEIIYHAPDRPDRSAHDKATTSAELRAQRSEEQRQVKVRADEFYDEWVAGQNPYRPPSEPARAKARLDARRRAEQEFGVVTSTPHDPKAGARSIVGAAGGEGKPAAATAPTAKSRLAAVTDPTTLNKIKTARAHNYSDEQIATFLGL